MNDLTITKQSGGLNRRNPSGDAISGLIASGVAVAGGAQLNTHYELASLDDAVSLGIDADYDQDEIIVYAHIREFFRVNPNGTLHLMIVAQATTFAEMVDKAEADNAIKLIQQAKGAIRQLGVVYNPAVAVADNAALLAAIPKAQELSDDQFTLHRPLEIILEGKGFTTADATDFRALNASNVSVMVGQAMSIAATHPTYAAVGTALGAVSLASVNESLAWVQKFNMLGGDLQAAGIGGIVITEIAEGTLNAINTAGAIFFREHVGTAGIYFNDSHTCVEITSDYAYIEFNRVIHKAARLIRTALLPELGRPVRVNSENGTLKPSVVKRFESLGRDSLESLVSDEEASDVDITVDPDQNVISTDQLTVEFEITPTGTARNIKVTLGFVNPF
ncbi:MAG: hypothetical protein EP346_06985 [Bacteroidetes bacterium]|nr:MAG: hypothetical protein EP346_06985 [Bacteroidota bacterium]